jgi:Right handed beta helix region
VRIRARWGHIAAVTVAVLMVAGCGEPAAMPTVSSPPTSKPASSSTATPTATPAPAEIPVPASIDATGATDASAALTSFVATVPDGSTIVFPAGGVYLMGQGLKLTSRHSLTFEGNGATLRSNGVSACARDCSLFYLWFGNWGITIRNFILVGNSPTPGIFNASWEHASAITVVGGGDVEIADITVSAVGGDGLTLSGVEPDWPDGVWFHDSHVVSSGRMGVAVVAGTNVTVERVTFDRSGYGIFDIEPNDTTQGASSVRFVDNAVGSWSHEQGFFFAANGAAGSVVRDVTVSGNTVTGSPLTSYVTVARRQRISVTDNTSTIPAAGPVLRFAHVDGLTVTGNLQPLASGVLTSAIDCTGVIAP